MRIERIELDGFGRFADAAWTLGEGLTVVLGANEAGKTTLLNAVRALLFGFEATRDGRTWYPPLAGGRRGGRLLLVTAAGERWAIERHGERGGLGTLRVTAPNGNQGGQETLNELLRGADRELFSTVFAFGLGELEAFSSLSGEGVSSRIYGAGAGLAGTSAVDLERSLRAEQEAAFRPRGREQTINRLLAEIEALRQQIAALERQPQEYEAARAALRELRERRATLRAQRLAVVERRERLGRLIDARAAAVRLRSTEQDLEEGDARADALSAEAVPQLERWVAAAERAASEMAEMQESIDAAERRLSALTVDEALLAEAAEINALRDERLIHVQRAAAASAASAAVARLEAELDDLLRRVGGWSEERLLSMDDSIAGVEATRELERRMAGARDAVTRLAQTVEAERAELAASERGLGPTAGLDAREVAARRAAVADLSELRREEAALVERDRLRSALPSTAAPAWQMLSLVVVACLLGGALVGSVAGATVQGGAAGIAVGVAAALALRAQLARQRGLATYLAPSDDARRDLLRRRNEALARLGLSPDADDAAVADVSDALAAAQHGAAAARDHAARLDERRAAADRAAAALDARREELAAAEREWRAWLTLRSLPDDVTPETARQLIAAATTARRLVSERDDQRRQRDAAAEARTAFDRRLDAVLTRLGRAVPAEEALRPAVVVGLADELGDATDRRRAAATVGESLLELRRRREIAAEQVARAEREVGDRLAAAGASSADELRALAAIADVRRDLRQAHREARATLMALAGEEAAVPSLVDEALRADSAALVAQRDEATADAERLEAEEDAAANRTGALEADIRRLEASDELGTLRQRLAILIGRAEAEARSWATRAVALALLAETRRRYERERQPQVVRDAEAYFSTITDGRYTRIVAPPGEENVRVEPESGSARATDELSRGTAEQLYLALRFGLIEQFARTAEPLPVVMDDILVNFDPQRAARAAGATRDLARRHQVLFFTCHHAMAALLDPDGGATIELL